MECETYRLLLDDFVDGELAETEHSNVIRHLHECSECSQEVDFLRRLSFDAASLSKSIQPERNLWPKIEAEIIALSPCRSKSPSNNEGDIGSRKRIMHKTAARGWAIAVAMLGMLLIAGAYLESRKQTDRDSSPELASNVPDKESSDITQAPANRSPDIRAGDPVEHKSEIGKYRDVRSFANQPYSRILKDIPPLPGHIRKAVIFGDFVYFLTLGSTSISIYSLIDNTGEQLDISANGIVSLMGSVQDFVVDSHGIIHILTFLMPMKESGIIRYDSATKRFNCVYLSKPIYAYQMDMDRRGDYYLLGFNAEYGSSWSKGGGPKGMINVVHKFSSYGQHMASFLPINSPATIEKFTEFFSSLNVRNSFAVPSSENIYYYQLEITPDHPPWDSFGITHRVSGQSFSSIPTDMPNPKNCWLQAIHKYKGHIAYEWAERGNPASKLLTRNDGTSIMAIPEGGRILAMNDGSAVVQVVDRASNNIFISFLPIE